MKNLIFIIFIILPFITFGQVVCYDSWKTFNDNAGDTIDNIMVYRHDNAIYYDLNCKTEDKSLSKRIKNDIIVAKKDSLVLINSSYLKRRLVNTSGGIFLGGGYIPFYYSDKIKYIVYYQKYPDAMVNKMNLGYMLGGVIGGVIGGKAGYDYDSDFSGMMFCILDFRNHKVVKVDEDVLKSLLVSYPEIIDAFWDTPKYKRQSVINHYFIEYVKALHCDSVYHFTRYVGQQKNSSNDDKVCLYDSWISFNENKGDTINNISVCKLEKSVLYDLKCKEDDKKLSKRIKKNVIVAKSDSLMLINSAYLKKRFKNMSDMSDLKGYVPFYYSDKIYQM